MPTSKQERERARRKLQEQLERRKAAEARRRRTLIGVTVVATLAVIGVVLGLVIGLSGGSGGTTPSANGSSSAASSASAAPAGGTTGPCAYKPADTSSNPNLKDVGLPPDPDPTPTIDRTLTFNTNLGTISVQLDGAGAPCNVQSITYLAQKGFYNGTTCPRTVNSGIFVVQCGDPSGTTAGGPTYTTKDENLSNAKYTAGTLAMANSGADTNGSQFFFITADSQLGQNYTVIGHVTAGEDILDKVVAAGNDGSNQAGGGKPNQALDFTTVTVSPELDLSAGAGASASPSGAEGSPSATPPAGVTSPADSGAVTGSPISS